MRRSFLSTALVASVLVSAFAVQALAVGHYEMVWWRQWDRSECGMIAGQVQVWVFDEAGNRMGNVQIRDHNGNFPFGLYQATPSNGEKCEIVFDIAQGDIGVQCYDGTSTSDITPIMTSAYGGDYGHYVYDVGFVYKTDGNSSGDANDDTWGVVPTRTNGSDDNPYTKSIVYSHQYWENYFSATPWDLPAEGGANKFAQSFVVASDVNRIMGVFMFPVQPFNPGPQPTTWKVEIREGAGPNGALIYSKTTPFPFYFGQPLAFGRDDCPVSPGGTYTVVLDPLSPSDSNAYRYPGTNYANGHMWADSTAETGNDMFGLVYGWDAGIGVYGMVKGTVTDTNGSPLSNALVTLIDESTGLPVADGTRYTSPNGGYLFGTVLPGTYTIRSELAGYADCEQTGQMVVVDQTTVVDCVMGTLVQELSNSSFELDMYAWQSYGADSPALMRSGILGIGARSGSHWVGVLYPGAVSTDNGLCQRVPTIAGETYQAAFAMYAGTGGGEARIGVDPAGGTDPSAGTVQWSGFSTAEGYWSTDGDVAKRVNVVATGSTATVFLDYYTWNTTSVLAFDDVRFFRVTGPAASASRTFDSGWSLLTAPLLDSAGEAVTSVLDTLLGAGNVLEGNLFLYNGAGYDTYSTDFTNMDQTVGYVANLSAGATESHFGNLPADPKTVALDQDWNLIGQPGRYAVPADGLVFEGPAEPAWRVNYSSKVKYRSDGAPAGWTWVADAETVFEWTLYVGSAGSPDRYPRIKIRDAAELQLSYDAQNGWWEIPSGATRISGGVQVNSGETEWAVLAAPNTWHTIRVYYNDVTLEWSITINGLMDDLHHFEGTISGGAGGPYVQWGILSSDNTADFSTSYVAWGQNDEILPENWPPANKTYHAATQTNKDPSVDPGWGLEGSSAGYATSIGALSKSFDEAVDAGWIEGALVGYDEGYQIIKPAGGDGTSLDAWHAYWLKVNESGLSLKMSGPAETSAGASDLSSSVKLNLDADGCITSNFVAGMSTLATDGYEGDLDVSAPPAGPAGMKEVAFGTSLSAGLMLADVRPEPGVGSAKVWGGTAQTVNFAGAECKTVTVTWDLTNVGLYGYKLVDVTHGVETVMNAGGQYTFDICEPGTVDLEIHAIVGGWSVESHVDAWSSIRTHAGSTTAELPIDELISGTGTNYIIETRDGGVQKILVDLDQDVTGSYTAGQIMITPDAGNPGGNNLTVTGEQLINGGTTLEVLVSGSTDLSCYTVDIANSIVGLVGDTDLQILVVKGDVNSSGGVNLIDAAPLKVTSGTPGVDAPVAYDVNLSNSVNLLDFAVVKVLSGSAPCGLPN